MGTRRKFSKEFKQDAVELVTVRGHDLVEVARDLGIRPDNLRRWKRQFEEDGQDAFPGSGRRKPEDEEMHQMRMEVRRLREEREILKKALAVFSGRRR